MAKFLADQLRTVIATRSYSRQKWTKSRVASYITGSTKIVGEISETTIGRFLNRVHTQKANEDTLRMIAEFLMLLGYVSSEQLQWAEAPEVVQAGLSLKRYYGVENSSSNRAFWREFEGHFVSETFKPPFHLRNRLVIDFLEDENLLIATEFLELLDLSKPVVRAFDAAPNESAIRNAKLCDYRKQGVIHASVDLILLFMRGDHDRFHSLLSVRSMVFDDDELIGLKAERSGRWKAVHPDDLDLPETVGVKTDHFKVLELLANSPQYFRAGITDFLAPTADNSEREDRDERAFAYSSRATGEMTRYETATDKFENANEADERLQIAIDFGYLDLFKRALKEGANPNYNPPGYGGPTMLFSFVFNGRDEWVDALLELENAGLYLGVNKDGLRPSQIAYFAAQPFRKHARDLYERFTDMEKKLYIREVEADDVKAGTSTLIKPDEPS